MKNDVRAGAVRLAVCACCLLTCALLAGGCAKARAATAPDGPPLQVPEPPPRVFAPVEESSSAPVPASAPEPPPPAASAPRNPPRPAPDARSQPAPAATPPPAAGRELRAAPSGANAATERTVRDALMRADRDLRGVNYGRLSAAGRATYDQSKRFSQQAEQALKERNVVFAATLADKAATLAAELLGR